MHTSAHIYIHMYVYIHTHIYIHRVLKEGEERQNDVLGRKTWIFINISTRGYWFSLAAEPAGCRVHRKVVSMSQDSSHSGK